MRSFVVTLLISSVACRPDGPGGHHHHGHHGDHGHHAPHGTVSLGSHQVGGVISIQPAHHSVHQQEPVHHSVHHQQEPVHVVHSVHSVQPVQSHHSQHSAVSSNTVVSSPVDTKTGESKTVAELLTSNPKLSTLLTAVKAADLMDTLSQPGPFTVFAPTNTAFDKVPVDQLNSLLADQEALKKVLLRHVVPATKMQGKNFPPGTTNLQTAAGEEISVTRDKFIQLKSGSGSAFIVLFDVIATNGVIHAVDTVI